MKSSVHIFPRRVFQAGVGMVETMVGVLIGMIVIVVIFNILSVAEGYKRATIGASDAQITGLLSQFVVGRDIGNGGAGITMSNSDMLQCANPAVTPDNVQAAVRPIPVLIIQDPSPGAGKSDKFIAYSAGAAHVMWPVQLQFDSAAGASIVVQSPNGFTVPVPTAAAPYWVVVMNGATCELARVTAAVPDPLPAPPAIGTGDVTLTQGVPATSANYFKGNKLLNLGLQGLATRIQYDVDLQASGGQLDGSLRTTDLLVPAAVAPVPVAQNIVLMKAQYGVDTNADGIVDCWTPADASTCGDFSTAAVRGFALAQLNRILAVRVGVVVRSDEPDLRLLTDRTNTDLQAESRALLSATRPPVVLFNCSANTNGACQSRVIVPAGPGVVEGGSNCQPAVICDYWRYRTYETVIPLRNAIYSASIPP